ncbi:MAG TPA: tetratricopeptide repeat protein [Terrimicrobiaceae bacterium]|nr:tetratricopeptide repeat protein [Terrimicrobiaceae bacterium]
MLQRAGKLTEAKRVLDEAAGSGNANAAEMLAGILEEEGEIRAAAELLEKVAAAHENQSLLVRLGELLQKAGEKEKSRAALERAAALAPGDLGLRKRLAAASASAGDGEAAAGHLRVIAEHGSPSERFSAWGEISLRFEEAGKTDEAIAAQEALLGLMGPGHWQLDSARRRLFNLRSENNTLNELEKRWLADAEARPRDPSPALRMAKFYEFQGDVTRQRDWLVKASTLLPKDVRLAAEVASLELSMGNPESAADRYDTILALRPDDADIVFLRAETAALLGEEEEAQKRVEDYLAAHQNDSAAEARTVDFYRRMRLSGPLERKLSAASLAHPDDEQAASELARFYLEQRRDAEAIECLARFDDSRLDQRDAAAVAFRYSELLKESSHKEEERHWARKAFEKDPSRPEYALRLADLLQAEGQTDAMLGVLRQACEVRGNTPPREDLERRLFLALQSKGRATSEVSAKPPAPSVKEMIASLDAKARKTGGEAAWLRLARWLSWADAGASPTTALRRGLEATPQSAALQEALAVELADSGDQAAAIQALKRLAELAPERSTEIQRRIGHLEFDRGNSEDGLRIFQSLADESKDWQAVADLALAQQMGGNWFDAFETWQRAYSLASPGARRSIRASILNAATRLQLYARGLDFFEKACVAEGDAATREELLNEAAAFAVEHGTAEQWRLRLERRMRASPEELAWREGLVSLFSAEGRVEEARQALKATAKVRGDSVEAIERLLKLAENAEDWDEAASFARRLVSLVGAQDPSPSMRYAGFLERAQREDEAEGVWQTLAARYARSPQVLSAAGDFFERSGKQERAEAFYRAAIRFRECAPQVRLRLGRFALDRGDRSQALADFEDLLAQTRPEIESFKDCVPLPDRVHSAPAQSSRAGALPVLPWKLASETESEGCRLLAIREAGQLLARSPQREKWCENFSESVERIWAKYYSGDKEAAFSEIEKLASAGGGVAVEQGFAALAFEEKEEDRLGQWASNDPAKSQARWENVLAAFSRMLEAKWRPAPEFLTRVFGYAPPLARWQASEALADKGHLLTACTLGETVPGALQASQACSAWMQMARWRIALCDPDEAIRCLDQAIDSAPSAISFSEPLFSALRARWLLTPDTRRPAFEEELTGRLAVSKHRKCQVAAQALIAGLKGDDSSAAEKIAEVVRDLGTSEGESWPEFFQQGGNQLEEWKLYRLARDLYRNDIARDPALLSMRGENFQDSTTRLLILNQFFTADSATITYFVHEWLARGPSDRELLDAVIRFQNSGRIEAAAAVYRKLCERNPRNEGICAGILNLARIRLMRKPGAAFMERLLAEEFSGTGRAMTQTAALRLAGMLDEDGEYDRSLALLNRLVRGVILNKALLFQHIQALRRAGRHREALSELEGNPLLASLPEFAVPLAELYAACGRERDAFALLEREARGGSTSRRAAAIKLRELAMELNDSSRAAAAVALIGSVSGPPLQVKSPANEADWKRALADLGNVGKSEEERFRAGRGFLVLQGDLPASLRAQELERLERIARRNPSLAPEFYLLRKELADKFNSTSELMKELSAEWDSGRGSYHAGEVAIQILLDQRRYEELKGVLGEYLDDRHFNEQAWNQIGRQLLLDKQYHLAARVFSELNARAPGDSLRVLSLAEALSMSGKGEVAAAMVSSVKRVALVDPQRHSDLAEFYLKTGRAPEAKPHLLAAPRDARSGIAWINAMERFLERGDFVEARETILHALETPQGVPTRVLADYYWRSGEVFRLDPDVNEFDLPPRQFRSLQIEIAGRLVSGNDTDRAWSWIERISSLLDEDPGRRLLQSVEATDWNRAERLWEIPEGSLWDARCAAAQFFLRRAQATEPSARALKDLERAHELHPGSFSVAQAYAARLLQENDPAAARKVLRNVIDAWAEPADRRAARQMLASLQASPSLPKGN